MENLFGKVSTHIRRKVNELVAGYNTHTTNIATNTSNIASIRAGNIAEVVAAAGNAIGNATVLSASKFIHVVTGADAAKGVKLPAGTVNMVHIVVNPVNAILLIYPQATEKIDSGTAGVALSGTALYAYIMVYVSAAVGWNTTKFLVAD